MHSLIKIVAIATCLNFSSVWGFQANRPDPAEGTVWDLSPLFASGAAWDAGKAQVEAALPGLAALRGTLGKSAQALQTGLDRISTVRLQVDKLTQYAELMSNADSTQPENQARQQSGSAVNGKFQEAISFVKPEILAIGRTKIEAMERQNPGLARHKRPLELILRTKAHTLSPPEEALLAATQPLRDQPQAIWNILINSDIQYTIEPKNSNPDREVRRINQEGYFKILKTYEGTTGAILAAHLTGADFEAKARHYPSSIAMMLDANAMSEKPFRALVAGLAQGAPAERRYAALRKELLHLDEVHTYDLLVPLQRNPKRYNLTEGEDLILKAVAPLGEDYVRRLSEGFHAHRMHAIAQPGKAPGAMMDTVYGAGPFILLTYDGSVGMLSAVAHEWGHAIHSQLAQEAQPYETASYSPFLGDAASLTNEFLLSDYMIAQAKTRAEKVAALTQEILTVRLGYFGAGLGAQFEAAAHEAASKGEPLTGARFTKMYCDLLRGWYGDSVKIEDNYCTIWMESPMYYASFYNYKYMTATSAAAYFVEGIERNDRAARDKYFEFLRAGGSDDPAVLLRRAGFDAESEASYLAMGRRLDRLVTELEAAVKLPE